MNSKIERNIEKTFELLENSHSPYSNFRVASSVITKENHFYGGVNIENISYGLTMCAERCAIYNAITNGIDIKEIDYIIIVTNCTDKLFPCGACLQVLSEFLNKNTKIIISSYDKKNRKKNRNEFLFKELLQNVFHINKE